MDVLLAILSQFGLYGLLTLGVAIIFAALRVVNLAQGDLAMTGAYVAATATTVAFGWRVLLACVLCVAPLMMIERILLRRPLADGLATMLVTWGVGMALRQVAELVFTSTSRTAAAPVESTVELLGTPYPAYRLISGLVAVAVIGAVLFAAYRTGWGLTLRAVADNPTMAALLGTDPRRMRTAAFVAGGMLAVLAGALYSPLLAVNPSMGFGLLVPMFFALLFSRPGALGAAVTAAFLVAALAVLLRTWLTDTLADALFYIVIIGAAALRSRSHVRRLLSWSRRILSPARSS
ncbi:branched-chain amino acid transport system permease protein/urea transport system permease protein [Nonomuraea polychroma]|uniref:Branched-chain amino acid transport system permease protein/urea transport system permease protein n=1 Tax=Nonomuraea polychroma TaxID=46176 RepID=A0A438M2P3_9ACTN|nr:branched-chain amino acid ABC transporter permease [Nonomuraea polychroma]RVX39803.1 branched-chain amino acid transport system permease protein/urea transport system permease protein [Nonomuraea polychroma]